MYDAEDDLDKVTATNDHLPPPILANYKKRPTSVWLGNLLVLKRKWFKRIPGVFEMGSISTMYNISFCDRLRISIVVCLL